MEKYFVLDERGEPLEEPDFEVWSRWFEQADRCVARTSVTRDITVLTIFSGIDVAEPGRYPFPFQTDVLGGWLDGEQKRHRSRADAIGGHVELVEWCRLSCAPDGGITDKDIT